MFRVPSLHWARKLGQIALLLSLVFFSAGAMGTFAVGVCSCSQAPQMVIPDSDKPTQADPPPVETLQKPEPDRD